MATGCGGPCGITSDPEFGAYRCDRTSHTTPDEPAFATVNGSLDSKYGFSFDAPFPMWVVPPDRVIAFDPDTFATSPTQFTFGDAR